jgi:L-threonylcarbamoyladenylate synthase
MGTRVITVRPSEGSTAVGNAAREGAAALRAGKLVAFATETVYGLAALATEAEAMARLQKVKSRPDGPFSLHLAAAEGVGRYVADIPPRARWLMAKAWPGPVTLLLDTGGRLAEDALNRIPGLYRRLTSDGVIGLRCPDEPVARRMLAEIDGPVVAPSANPAGAPSPRCAEDVLQTLEGQIDLLIDSGPSRFGRDSSIVRVDGGGWTLLRKGVYDERMIGRCLRRKIGFVCTGNTCRSPLAAALGKKLLAERLGCPIGQLRANGVEVWSAGLFAATGVRATLEAVNAAKKRGLDLSRHKSRKLTSDLIKSSDVVFCMTQTHLSEAKRLAGDSAAKLCRLADRDLPDPLGGGDDVYNGAAEDIEQAIRRHMDLGVL